MANGLGAALTALIVSTQPLLTTALAITLFGEKPRAVQWLGIAIGFIGVVVVLSPSLNIAMPTLPLLSSLTALLAITDGQSSPSCGVGLCDKVSGGRSGMISFRTRQGR